MSAAGIVISENEIHMLSDGILSYKDESGEWQVEKRNVNKVKMINETTGLLWLGAGLIRIWNDVKSQLKDTTGKPWEISYLVSNTLQKYYAENEISLSARVLIAGFDDRKPVLFQVTSYNEFEIEPVEFPAGSVYAWAMIFGSKGDNPFPGLVGQYLKISNDLGKIANQAFHETVQQYANKQVNTGGCMFWRAFGPDGTLGGSDRGETGVVNSGLDDDEKFYHAADDSSGTNAKAFFRADGFLSSPSISDSLVFDAQTNAAFGQNPSPAPAFSFTNNWSVFATQSGQGITDDEIIVKRIRFRKKPGTTKVIFTFWARKESDQPGSGTGSGGNLTEVRLKGGVGIQDSAIAISATSFTRHVLEAEFDEADLFNDIDRIVEIAIYAKAEVIFEDTSPFIQEAETFLNDDLIQFEQAV